MDTEHEETVRLVVLEHRDDPDWGVQRFAAVVKQEAPTLPIADKARLWEMYGTSTHTHDPATGRRLTPEQIAERNYGSRSQR